MKYILDISSIFIILLLITSCTPKGKISSKQKEDQIITIDEKSNQIISITKGENFDHPTFVVWLETPEGDYISTFYITKSYATGRYSHEMVGDSIWLDREGPSYQPAALPYWTYKKGLINNTAIVPSIENPFIDAYTGATPKGDLTLKTAKNDLGKYQILLEINQLADWNHFWTNNKYPLSQAYKHSAQPSLVYAVTIDDTSNEFYLNPIGHGDPLGMNGILNTNISTLTSAKEILHEVKVVIEED